MDLYNPFRSSPRWVAARGQHTGRHLRAVAMGMLLLLLTVSIDWFVSAKDSNASNCPFCASINQTFTEQIAGQDVVVFASLVEAPALSDDPDAPLPKATFEIAEVIKGKDVLEAGMEFKALLVGRYPPGKKFLVMGVEPPHILWTTPVKASDRLVKYLKDIQTLPESGHERLLFFQDYFEDAESAIAFDAYDEFAKAPYSDLLAMRDQMDREALLGWIKDPETSINRRRLYLTMLGVCGKPEDAQLLADMITEGGNQNLRGLDALIACYLSLAGEEGLALIEREFISNEDCLFTYTMDAITALRFHGTEGEVLAKERVVAAVRKLLDRPRMADLIIPDLARWQDWSVVDRLATIFKEAREDNRFIRVLIAQYMMECPESRAKSLVVELQEMDPLAFERAKLFGRGFDDMDDDDSEAEPSEEPAVAKAGSENKPEEPAPDEASDDTGEEAIKADPLDEPAAEKADLGTDLGMRYQTRKVAISTDPVTGENNLEPNTQLPKQPLKLAKQPLTKQPLGNAATTEVAANEVPTLSDGAAVAAATTLVAVTPWLTLKIILIPAICAVLLFGLLWSVVSGSFQRLIF